MIKLKNGILGLLCTALLLPALAVAQDDEGPQWLSVRTVTAHASGVRTWVERQQEMSERRKEVGAGTRHVWQEINGNLDTFHIVTFPENFAGGDTPPDEPLMGEAQDEWEAAIGPTIDSRSTMVLRYYPELSRPPEEGVEPALLVLRYHTVAPGKSGDYQAWLSDQLLPALDKVGVTGMNTNRVVRGGDTNLWIRGSRVPNFAALDQPGPLMKLSQEERAELFGGLDGVVWINEVKLLRYRADMSNAGPQE